MKISIFSRTVSYFVPLALCVATVFVTGACSSDGSRSSGSSSVNADQVDQLINNLDAHAAPIAEFALDFLRLAETYTPENFETRQRAALEQCTPDFREAALAYLPKRVAENQRLQSSVTFIPDKESVIMKSSYFGSSARIRLKVKGVYQYASAGKSFDDRQANFEVQMIMPNFDQIRVLQWTIKTE